MQNPTPHSKRNPLYIHLLLGSLLLTGCGGASADQQAPITEETAKEIALTQAGLAANDVRFGKIELDREDGRQIYEIEFFTGNTEYDYEIDAATGEILSAQQETR